MPEHELDAPRRSEMKFDALSGEPTNSSRGRYPVSGPRLQTAPKTGSRSRVATPSGAALQPRFRRNPGPAPWLTSGISPDPRWACRRAITGPSNWPRAHSRKRECRSRLLRRAPRADGLPECEPPPTVRSAPITVAMPGRIFWKLRRWGPVDIQRLGQACLLDCAPTGAAGRRLSTSFRTVPYGSNDVQSCQGFALDVALLDRVVARRGVREYKNFPNTQFELRSKM